jgi:hypothetical protein
MSGCKVDPAVSRKIIDGFKFPLGVYPVEDMKPKAGYALLYEPADGDEFEGEWEAWPDRYCFDAVVSADRVHSLARALMALLPGRVYPILDVLGLDAYREIDPYISYELIGADRLMEDVRRFHDFFFEDGMIGFGAMSEDPFFYFFIDEHKIVTIRARPEMKEKLERLLHCFDLEQMEEPAGADAAAHEHRGVLIAPDDVPDLLTFDEIVERLKDDWRLLLNIDPDSNIDAEGRDLGVTHWRCVVRCDIGPGTRRYAEILLDAASLRTAEELAFDTCEALGEPEGIDWDDAFIVSADRIRAEQFEEVQRRIPAQKKLMLPASVHAAHWLS